MGIVSRKLFYKNSLIKKGSRHESLLPLIINLIKSHNEVQIVIHVDYLMKK